MLNYEKARVMLEELTQKHMDFIDDNKVYQRELGVEIPAEIQEKLHQLANEEKKFGKELMACPEFFDLLKCYMVDVNGKAQATQEGMTTA